MQKLKSGLVALTVGIVLLTALDWAASAATGRAFVLGRWNQADHTTTLKNTAQGPALDLRTKKGPALKVNNSKRIKKLNADKLDGLSVEDYKTNRNTIYAWSVASHTGGFTQAIPPQAPGSYLITFDVQLTGAAGDPANPNVINCRIIQSGVSGAVTFTKSVLADTQVTSVGTPPALNGTSPHHRRRGRLPGPRLHDDPQRPGVVDDPVPAGPGEPAPHRRLVRLHRAPRPHRHPEEDDELTRLVEEVAQRPSRGPVTGPLTSHGVS